MAPVRYHSRAPGFKLALTLRESGPYTSGLMASPWKEVQSEDEIEDLTVRLTSVAGVSPRVYVPVIWGALVLTILFLLLVVPGLRRHGEEVRFTSTPEGAAIFVDGTRVGATPSTHFVDSGVRTVEVVLGGDSWTADLEIRGRLLGSLLFPPGRTVHTVLDDPDLDTVPREAAEEFAAWALAGDPSAQFQQPPAGHDGARRLWAAGEARDAGDSSPGDAGGRSAIDRFRRDLLAHAAPHQVRDLSAALLRSAVPGSILSPQVFSELVQFFIQVDNESPALVRQVETLVSALPAEADPTEATGWATDRRSSLSTALLAGSLAPDEGAIPVASAVEVGGMRFVSVPAGTYVLGYPLRDAESDGLPVIFADPFWIRDRETTRGDFARFLRDHPEWAPDQRENLRSEGYVDDAYLRDWPEDWERRFVASPDGDQPLGYVSWHAADAYVQWLNDSLGADVAGVGGDESRSLRFALPTAAHWEYAAFLDSLGGADVNSAASAPRAVSGGTTESVPGALGAYDLAGNLWEWTADWYALHRDVFQPSTGDQIIVVGGSFATGEARHDLQGAQPPTWSTPFLGFRPIIVGESDSVEYDG
jgi:formylglycine-generating enzyme required for sulfatase activity